MRLNIPKPAYVLIGLVVLLFAVELFAPKPIDWTRSYEQNDKRPYGCYIFNDLLKRSYFPKQKVIDSYSPFFEYKEGQTETCNYIFVANKISLQGWDLKPFLKLIEEGNQVFIATTSIGGALADTLNIGIESAKGVFDFKQKPKQLFFQHPRLKGHGIEYPKAIDKAQIERFNKDSIVVLAFDERKQVQFLKMKIGKGNLFLCSQPLAFTNYNVLDNQNVEFISKAMSYLPQQTVVWDTYYKPLREMRKKSPLHFFFRNRALRYAIYLLILTTVCLLTFNVKRKQRAIPIVKPLANTSLQFIQTLGRLYHSQKNHKDIALKKLRFLKDFVRTKYYCELNEENLEELSVRMEVPLKTLEMLLSQSKYIMKSENVSENTLKGFHKKIYHIYTNCK